MSQLRLRLESVETGGLLLRLAGKKSKEILLERGADVTRALAKLLGKPPIKLTEILVVIGAGSFSATRAAFIAGQVLAAVTGARLVIQRQKNKFYAAAPHITRSKKSSTLSS